MIAKNSTIDFNFKCVDFCHAPTQDYLPNPGLRRAGPNTREIYSKSPLSQDNPIQTVQTVPE